MILKAVVLIVAIAPSRVRPLCGMFGWLLGCLLDVVGKIQ